MRTEKSSYVVLWLIIKHNNKTWSILADFFLFLTRFCVNGVILRCSDADIKMSLSGKPKLDKFLIKVLMNVLIVLWQWYNLGQKVGDKFTKLSEISFSLECFTDDVLQFFTKKRQNLETAGYSPSNPSISGIFLKLPNFLRS